MTTPAPPDPLLETDPRFPSGPWRGFFLQNLLGPGKFWMDLHLTFHDGRLGGEGRDKLGAFHVTGRYHLEDGKRHWSKRYAGRHEVAYEGYNEGKGIWGTWKIPPTAHGGFHIWPVAMGDPETERLAEEVGLPEPAVAEA